MGLPMVATSAMWSGVGSRDSGFERQRAGGEDAGEENAAHGWGLPKVSEKRVFVIFGKQASRFWAVGHRRGAVGKNRIGNGSARLGKTSARVGQSRGSTRTARSADVGIRDWGGTRCEVRVPRARRGWESGTGVLACDWDSVVETREVGGTAELAQARRLCHSLVPRFLVGWLVIVFQLFVRAVGRRNDDLVVHDFGGFVNVRVAMKIRFAGQQTGFSALPTSARSEPFPANVERFQFGPARREAARCRAGRESDSRGKGGFVT